MEFAGLIFIDKDVHQYYLDLVSRKENSAKSSPFITMKDMFITAACVGAKFNQYKELSSKDKDITRGEYLSKDIDIPVLSALAFQKTNNLETLKNPKEILMIAENWANGGIHILYDALYKTPGLSPLDNYIKFLNEN